MFHLFGMYRRYASVQDLMAVLLAASASALSIATAVGDPVPSGSFPKH